MFFEVARRCPKVTWYIGKKKGRVTVCFPVQYLAPTGGDDKDTQRGSCIEHSEMPFERSGNDDDEDERFEMP